MTQTITSLHNSLLLHRFTTSKCLVESRYLWGVMIAQLYQNPKIGLRTQCNIKTPLCSRNQLGRICKLHYGPIPLVVPQGCANETQENMFGTFTSVGNEDTRPPDPTLWGGSRGNCRWLELRGGTSMVEHWQLKLVALDSFHSDCHHFTFFYLYLMTSNNKNGVYD